MMNHLCNFSRLVCAGLILACLSFPFKLRAETYGKRGLLIGALSGAAVGSVPGILWSSNCDGEDPDCGTLRNVFLVLGIGGGALVGGGIGWLIGARGRLRSAMDTA